MQTTNILSWFKGKALENARAALGLLSGSEAQGFWIPGASRKVRAALSKANIAGSDAKALDAAHKRISYEERARKDACFAGYMLLQYGSPGRITHEQAAVCDEILGRDAVSRFLTDFEPAWALMAQLDATRPKPVFTSIGVSPTITQTLEEAGLKLRADTVRFCPTEWIKVERKNAKGVTETVWVMVLVWPAGTVHGSSRFHNYHGQCESCGHGIKNPYNWIPLLIDDEAGVPHSMWVGRDCSERIFGIKVKGEVELAAGQARPGMAPAIV